MVFGHGRGRGAAGRGFRGGGNRNGSFNKTGGAGFGKVQRGRPNFEQGPPERVVPLGFFNYSCQNDLVCKVEIDDVPYFNAPIFLENKEQIGKVDEIFGTVRDYSVSIKLSENVYSSSFKPSQKFFIDPGKLLPIARFLPKPPQPKGNKRKSNNIGGTNSQSRESGFGNRRGGRNGFAFRGNNRGGGGFSRGRGGPRGRW